MQVADCCIMDFIGWAASLSVGITPGIRFYSDKFAKPVVTFGQTQPNANDI